MQSGRVIPTIQTDMPSPFSGQGSTMVIKGYRSGIWAVPRPLRYWWWDV